MTGPRRARQSVARPWGKIPRPHAHADAHADAHATSSEPHRTRLVRDEKLLARDDLLLAMSSTSPKRVSPTRNEYGDSKHVAKPAVPNTSPPATTPMLR